MLGAMERFGYTLSGLMQEDAELLRLLAIEKLGGREEGTADLGE